MQENVLSLGLASSDEDDDDDDENSSSEGDSDDDIQLPALPMQGPDRSLKPFLANDDIVEERELKDIDERAWGKNQDVYYGTNVTDQMIRSK